MNFFQAQKKLAALWFIWGLLLMMYVAMGVVLDHYRDVLNELMVWLSKYLAVVFTLITGSIFFQRTFFEEQLRDKIYFRLAFISSVFYLMYITEILIVEPRRIGIDMDDEVFIKKLDQSGLVLNFALPTLMAFLAYFFYKNKKQA